MLHLPSLRAKRSNPEFVEQTKLDCRENLRFSRNDAHSWVSFLARTILLTACLALSPAFAADRSFFDKDDFEKVQSVGGRILVEVSAPWCPTCKVQAPIIQKYTALPENKSVTIFMVDFDTQKDELKYLKARSQSTLIMYKGKVETARSAGDTSEAGISALINSSK